LRKFW